MPGRHTGHCRRRWWRLRDNDVPQPPIPVQLPAINTIPYGIPISAVARDDDNARWLLQRLADDRKLALDFIQAKGLGHEFLNWKSSR